MNDTGERAMRRAIGPALGALLVVNATLGTGIFKTPAKVARLTGSTSAALAVWVAGAVIALAGALSFAELAAALPRTGGLYEYLRRAYGDAPAFLFGWTKLTLLIPSAVGSFAKLGAEAIFALAGCAPNASDETRVAIAFLVVCGAANLSPVRASALQQGVVTTAKYAGVAILAIAGLLFARPHAPDAPALARGPSAFGAFSALVSVMWAYDGWADLASLSGEVRDPEKSLPRALVSGTAAIGVVYLATNVAYVRVLGVGGLAQSTAGGPMPAVSLAVAVLGAAGRPLLSALVLVSCIGGCMSSLLTGSRVFVPLATDGLFLRALGAVSPRSGVPSRAVVACTLLGVGYVSVRSFEELTDGFVVGYFPFYILGVIAIFVLRKREPGLARPFRVPGYPVVPAIFLAGAAALLAGAAIDADRTALLAGGVMLAGVPARYVFVRLSRANA